MKNSVDKGEPEIPAIKGVGGGILRFIDNASALTDWSEIDFRPLETASPEKTVGVEKVDHLAQTMKCEDMLTWTLFYTSTLETEKVSMVDVVDQSGLLRSRAIQNVPGDLRITLNGTENLNTLAGQFIDRTFGAAVQHLAFGCEDIFVISKALEERGFEALELSPNYYEDLGASFGLQYDFLEQLKASKILYDQDDNGCHFQLYSRQRTSEFFFRDRPTRWRS